MPATPDRSFVGRVDGLITGRRTAWAVALVPLLVAIAVMTAVGEGKHTQLSTDSLPAGYDSTAGTWRLTNWLARDIGDKGDALSRGLEKDTLLPLRPNDLGQRVETAMALTTPELNTYIADRQRQGDGKVGPYLIEKHQRTAYPLATYIFTLIGVGIASRKVRGGTGLHLALGVMLVLVYFFVVQFTTVAATNAGLDPFLAVWLPNIGYALIGIWIYRTAPK